MPDPRTLTIQEVTRGEPWSNAHGNFDSYQLKVGELGDPIVWNRKQGSDVPSPGDEITGVVTQTDHGLKFTLQKASSSPQAPTQQSSNNQRTDATGRSIERQVSAKAAAEMLSSVQGIASAEAMGQAFSRLFDVVDGKVRGEA